uniref:Uncharacterized protein n=1 Tax=Quercus lobata TaxID=97700 RepID=A0A7N2M8N8_QUELO
MEYDMNIRHLILKTSMHPYEFFRIVFFLNSSPYLETLTLDIGPGRIFYDYSSPVEGENLDRFWLERSMRYTCRQKS